MPEVTNEQREILLEWFVDSMDLDNLIDFYVDNMNNLYNQNPDILVEDWERELDDLKEAGLA